MTGKRPEADDPMMLVGVSLPADLDSVKEMAATFADEFAALGYSENRLLNLFRQPFYAGAHHAFQILGEVEIRRLIREARGFWGGRRITVHDTTPLDPDEEELVQIGSPDPLPTGRDEA